MGLPTKAGSIIRITAIGPGMAYIYDVGDLFVLEENGWWRDYHDGERYSPDFIDSGELSWEQVWITTTPPPEEV